MRRLILTAALCLSPLVSFASPGPLATALPDAEQRGTATFRYLGLPVYKARLFTPAGQPLDWRQDFAIELTYLRRISAETLVDSTLQELTRTGGALSVGEKLGACFAVVSPGDRYLALSKGRNTVQFWRNDRLACTLRHDNIKARFMAIFVGDNTRSRSFTARLRGD